jgi:uncharacterized protein (TIGR02266 family)
LTAAPAALDTGLTVPSQRDQVVRVRLRYPDLDTFVEKYAPNVTRGGIFLASREPRPVGEVLRFEVLLRQGDPVLSGRGRVAWVKEFNPAEPHRPYGMGVQFLDIDPAARPVLERLLERKHARPSGPQTITGPQTPLAPSRIPPPSPQPASSANGAAEDLDDTALRRTLERARLLTSRTDDLDALLAAEPDEPVTLSQALDDLPRLLAGKRTSSAVRLLGDDLPDDKSAS